MDMVERFLKSTKPRPAQAKQIPGLETNFFDPTSEFAEGFSVGEKKGDPTKFSAKALDYFKVERNTILIPDGFQPTEAGIGLTRYSPENKYYNPGTPSN